MSTYLVSYPVDSWPWGASPIPKYSDIIKSWQYNDGVGARDLFLCVEDMSVEYPTEARIVGAWNNDGSTIVQIHADYSIIRPMGNDSGLATDALNLHHWAGHAQRHMQESPVADTAPQYPADNQPFAATLTREWDDTPGWEGWGWVFTIEFVDPNRAPNLRAISIYTDADFQNFLYTTGALILEDTGEIDENSNPILKYRTHNMVGRAAAVKEDIHYKLIHGAAPEGQMTLATTQDSQQKLFWEHDQ